MNAAAVKPLLAVIATIVALALPAVASAGLATITFRDVPLPATGAPRAERTLAGAPGRFDLVGVRWHGTGNVQFSVRSMTGAWGAWLGAASEEDDQPDAGSPEARASRGWRIGNPTWVGPANGIRYRVTGKVRNLQASFVRSPEVRSLGRRLAGSADRAAQRVGCRRSIRRAEPSCRPTIGSRACTTPRASTAASQAPLHAGDRGLPRQVQRLERHRLTSSSTATAPSTRRYGSIDKNDGAYAQLTQVRSASR